MGSRAAGSVQGEVSAELSQETTVWQIGLAPCLTLGLREASVSLQAGFEQPSHFEVCLRVVVSQLKGFSASFS